MVQLTFPHQGTDYCCRNDGGKFRWCVLTLCEEPESTVMVNYSIYFQPSKSFNFWSVTANVEIYSWVHTYICLGTRMSNNDISELATCCSHLNSEFFCLLVKEKAAWLFLSRKESLRKRNTEHFLEAAQCLPNGIIRHNITGKITFLPSVTKTSFHQGQNAPHIA